MRTWTLIIVSCLVLSCTSIRTGEDGSWSFFDLHPLRTGTQASVIAVPDGNNVYLEAHIGAVVVEQTLSVASTEITDIILQSAVSDSNGIDDIVFAQNLQTFYGIVALAAAAFGAPAPAGLAAGAWATEQYDIDKESFNWVIPGWLKSDVASPELN